MANLPEGMTLADLTEIVQKLTGMLTGMTVLAKKQTAIEAALKENLEALVALKDVQKDGILPSVAGIAKNMEGMLKVLNKMSDQLTRIEKQR
jgi:hypothetical protein